MNVMKNAILGRSIYCQVNSSGGTFPTVEAIALAVRLEMDSNSSKLDVPVSSVDGEKRVWRRAKI
jgi:hypothetical protein